MINNPPLVSIVIVTRDRPNDVLRAVESCLTQEYERLEVFVYEDASEISVEPQLSEQFPSVHFERSEVQSGPTGLRDRGIRQANGEFVFSFDDDAYFTDKLAIAKVVQQFASDELIGAIALPLVEPSRYPHGNGGLEPDGTGSGRQIRSFIGACVAYRRKTFLEIGGVKDCYAHFQGDENDVAIRLLERGYRVELGGTEPVVHTVSPVRDLAFRFRHDCRSALLFDYVNVPFPQVIPAIVGHAIKLFSYKLSRKTLRNRIVSVSLGLWACVRFAHYRRPVSGTTYRKYRQLPSQGILAASALTQETKET